MAFRQHNPNVRSSRNEGGTSWKGNKPNDVSVPCHVGANAPLPSFEQENPFAREQTVTSGDMSRSWGQSSFSTRDNRNHDNAFLASSSMLATTASTSQTAGIYRIPTLNRNSLRPGIYDGSRTKSQRIPSAPFRLEKLDRLGSNPPHDEFVGIDRLSVSKLTTGLTKYAHAARANTAELPISSAAAVPFKVFEDREIDTTLNDQVSLSSPSTTLQTYVHKLHSHSHSRTGDSQSAYEAEVLLLEMISNYKSGLHDFQPDGGCYNRYDTSTEVNSPFVARLNDVSNGLTCSFDQCKV